MISIVNKKGNEIFEFKAKRKDGTLFDVLMGVAFYSDELGRRFYSGFSRDITEEKKQQLELDRYRNHLEALIVEQNKELAKSEMRYRKSSEIASEFTYCYKVSPESYQLELDWTLGSFPNLTGYNVSKTTDINSFQSLIYKEDIQLFQERIKKLIDGETVVSEYRIIDPFGKIVWIRDKGVPEINKETGKVTLNIGTKEEVHG